MIKNQWYAIMSCNEVKKKPVGVMRMNEKLVLWRDQTGKLSCIFDQCCHRGASLALGCVVGDHIECPFHGFLYDPSGKVVEIPANGRSQAVPDRYKVNAYTVKEAHGLIWLWYGDGDMNPLPKIPFFEDLNDQFIYSTFSEVWDVHYTRAIENQLDVVHLPFVHATTIGKGGRTVVNGPVAKWYKERMTFYVNNVEDTGNNKALKTSEMTDYEHLFSLQYQVPNLWQNRISPDVRVFAAFAPIDLTHTKIYLRFYQKFAPVPFIGKGIAMMSNVFNRIVLHQDRRVVLTQQPQKTELYMGEHLIPGDLPIVEFRKKRDALKKAYEVSHER